MSSGQQKWKDRGTYTTVSWFKVSYRGNSFISFFLISHAKYYLIRIKCISSLHDHYKYAYMEHVENIAIKLLDDRVDSIDMSLILNKFPLSPLTHQNLFKLL